MSIDFTGVTGIEDDYGNLTKITDASGRVIWSAVKKLTLTFVNTEDYSCDVSHSELGRLNLYQSLTYEVSPESVLTFKFEGGWDDEDKYREKVYVNGTNVFSKSLYGGDTASYTHTITKNATITINCPKYGDGRVDITET